MQIEITVKDDFVLGNRDGADGRQFHCPNCSVKLNSDHNAAINIANGGVVDKLEAKKKAHVEGEIK